MLKRCFALSLVLAMAALPILARANDAVDRGLKFMDAGDFPRARALFKEALASDPCDPQALDGLDQAGGDARSLRAQCGSALTPAPTEEPVASGLSTPGPDNAPMEYPTNVPTPALGLRERSVALAANPAAPAADETPGVNEVGADAKHHGQAVALPEKAEGPRQLPGWARGALKALLAGIFALIVALVGALLLKAGLARWAARPPRAAAPAPVLAPVPAPAAAPAADSAEVEPAVSEPVAPPQAPLAPPPQRAHQPAAAAPAQPWSSPLAPGEAVVARLDSASVQAGFTAHQFFFQGPRGIRDGWFSRQESMSLGIPLHQITGLAWSRGRGERLIVGTALAGDIVLEARELGALPLRQFAQALSQALDRPLA